MATPKISIKVVNGRIIATGGGKPDYDMGPVLNNTIKSAVVTAGRLILTLSDGSTADAGPISVVSITNISSTGLVSLSDGSSYQLNLPVVRGIASVSATGLITYTDNTTRQLTLPPGRGISSVSSSGLITYTDNTTQQLALPTVKSISSISNTGLITYTDNTTQQLTLPSGSTAQTYLPITGSDFNIPVSGVTTLGSGPTGTVSALFNVQGGDVYITETGTDPTSSSPIYPDGTQLRETNLSLFKCTAKSGSPALVGHYERVP